MDGCCAVHVFEVFSDAIVSFVVLRLSFTDCLYNNG
jgi:hypothetical protein